MFVCHHLSQQQKTSMSFIHVNACFVDHQSIFISHFTDDFMKMVVVLDWPEIIVVADGSHGETCSVLGLGPHYVVESWNAYGTNATITRLDQRQESYGGSFALCPHFFHSKLSGWLLAHLWSTDKSVLPLGAYLQKALNRVVAGTFAQVIVLPDCTLAVPQAESSAWTVLGTVTSLISLC